MIDQLFDWGGDWVQYDTWRFVFRGVVLKVQIGSFPVGSRPLEVMIDFRAAKLEITNNNVHVEEFDLRLVLETQKS